MARVPTVIRNFTLLRVGDPTVFLGIADIELPTFTAVTMELVGSGLAGKADVVIPGHFSNLATKITLHTPSNEFIDLCNFNGETLEARGIIQGKDTSTGQRYATTLKVTMVIDGMKTAAPGKLSPGEKSDSNADLTVSYIAYYLDGAQVLLYDFYNYIYIVNGVNVLAADMAMLGLA